MFSKRMFSRRLWSKRVLRNGWLGNACWLALVAGLLCASVSLAIAPTRLPSLSVKALDGTAVSTSAWQLKGHSLLIYVRGNCRPCDALLGRLSQKDYPHLAAHTTIIVGDVGPDGLKDLRKRYPDLSAATWYADPPRNVAAALHLQGAPVILGLKGNTVQWAWSGVMEKPAQQKSMLNKWCQEEASSQIVRK